MAYDNGKPVWAELHSTDASDGVPLVLVDMETRETEHTLHEAEHLSILNISGVSAPGGDVRVFFDLFMATAEAIVAASSSTDTFVIAGDFANEFRAGRRFEVANSTGNDATYTSTGATYDSGDDETTISVAAVTDNTADGDITSLPSHFPNYGILRGTYGTTGGEVNNWELADVAARGPDGHKLYAIAPSGVLDVRITALVRRDVTHNTPRQPVSPL